MSAADQARRRPGTGVVVVANADSRLVGGPGAGAVAVRATIRLQARQIAASSESEVHHARVGRPHRRHPGVRSSPGAAAYSPGDVVAGPLRDPYDGAMPLRSIDIGSCTREEFDAWQAEYVASVEDGSLRAEMTAESVAKGGHPITDDEWEAALMVSGVVGPDPDA
jgi:hypothetical protein